MDPIDGTKSFVSGSLCFGTQIGLTYRDTPVLGMINQPITNERWVGLKNQPATLNGKHINTSVNTELANAVVYTSGPEQLSALQRPVFFALANSTQFTRFSHDCYAAGLLAIGMVDIVVEANLFDYDIVPQIPIIEGAGGVVTDWNGRKLIQGSQFESVLMTANPSLHSKAIEILRS